MGDRAQEAGGGGDPTQDDDYFEGDPSFQIPGSVIPADPGADIGEGGELPTAGNDSEDDNPEDADSGESGGVISLQLTFSIHPLVIERGVNYEILIQALNTDGQIVNVLTSLPTITLSLVSGDPADVLNTSPVLLTGGQHTFTGVQITGGTGTDATIIQVTSSRAEWKTGIFNFTVIAVQLTTLTWDTVPATVIRNTVFTVAISGGAALDILDVQLAGSDTNDKLFDANGEVTQITLDGSGNFTASDWFISGGTDSDTGNFILHDPGLIFADELSSSFTIAGISKQLVSQTIGITQLVVSDNRFIEITQGGALRDGEPFTLTLTMKFNNGDTDTSFNGIFDLSAVDATEAVISFVDVGPEATSYTNFVLAAATNGIWTYGAVTMSLAGATSPITFNVVEFQGTISGTLDVVIADPIIFNISLPSSTLRATNFTMTVAAMDGDIVNTGFSEDVILSITLGDGSDSLSITSMLAATFTNGIATLTTQQITGGSGADVTEITATSASVTGSSSFTVSPTIILLAVGDKQTYFGFDSFATPGGIPDEPVNSGEFTLTQIGAQDAFDADVTLAADTIGISPGPDFIGAHGIACRNVDEKFTYMRVRALVEGGYAEFTPSAMTGLLSVYVRGTVKLLMFDEKPPAFNPIFSPNVDQYALNIKIIKRDAPDPLTFTSGAALKAMVPDQIISGAELLQLHKDVTTNPNPFALIDIRLDESLFEGMTETGIRLWMYMTGPVLPYAPPFDAIQGEQVIDEIGFLPTDIVLHKA